jgi:hypothetical protein
LKVECDDWYGRNLDAEQRDDGLKCIKGEKGLALVSSSSFSEIIFSTGSKLCLLWLDEIQSVHTR